MQMLLVFLLQNFCQQGFCIEWDCDGFTIRYAELLQNDFDVASLMGAGPLIPLRMNSDK